MKLSKIPYDLYLQSVKGHDCWLVKLAALEQEVILTKKASVVLLLYILLRIETDFSHSFCGEG